MSEPWFDMEKFLNPDLNSFNAASQSLDAILAAQAFNKNAR